MRRLALAAFLIAAIVGAVPLLPSAGGDPSGTEIVVRLRPAPPRSGGSVDAATVEQVRMVLGRRLPAGVEIVGQGMGGASTLVLRVPPDVEVAEVERRIRSRGVLEFREQRSEGGRVRWVTAMDGSHVRSAEYALSEIGSPVVRFRMDAIGAKRFGDLTGRLVGKPLGVFLDGKLLSAPVVREAIVRGEGLITPGGSSGSSRSAMQDARSLAAILNSGALPVALQIVGRRAARP